MFAAMVKLCLTRITDPAQHQAYNEWQHLRIQPQLRADPAILWADRWVLSPDCAAVQGAAAPHYAALTWFHSPVEIGLRIWRDAQERASRLGAPVGFVDALSGLFVPLKGYANPRTRIAPEALLFRPALGNFLLVSRFARRDSDAEAAYRWYDEVRIPDLLQCRGAAGAWSYATADVFRADRDVTAPVLRIVQFYLDDDPLVFWADMQERMPTWRQAGRLANTAQVEQVVFAAPLRSIDAWQWNWFNV